MQSLSNKKNTRTYTDVSSFQILRVYIQIIVARKGPSGWDVSKMSSYK